MKKKGRKQKHQHPSSLHNACNLGEKKAKVQEYACYFHEIYLDWCSSTLRAESSRLMHINWPRPLMASSGAFLNYEMRHSFCPLSLLHYSVSPLRGPVSAEKVTFIVGSDGGRRTKKEKSQTADLARNVVST